jgi:septum site-determining protein MinC
MAFVLTPAAPFANWLEELDRWTRTSPDFFVGRPIILDLAGLALERPGIAELIVALGERGIRVMGIEGVDADQLGPSLPPPLKGGRPTSGSEGASEHPNGAPSVDPSQRPEPNCLLIESTIRSGQSVIFPHGDVTVLGSVSSGAEVVAGGSVHVYGALRGRAMAGSMGNARARIFCSRNEAELISIDGYYRTAEEMDATLRNRPVQCWLEDRFISEDRALSIAVLD